VIAIDVLGLQRLLKVTGPVEVPDGKGGTSTVSADNVKKDLLLQQYLTYRDATDRRRERLGNVGTAVFEAFNERPVAASDLLRAFQQAGAGRNLLLWSSDPVEQAAWEALGAAGAVPADALMASIINRGGNKLDPFLKVKADLTSVTTGDNRRVTVQISIENTSPTTKDYPTYVVGPYPRTNAQRGEYLGIVSLTVPKGAGNPSSQGADLFLTGDDGPTRVLTSKIDVASGASTQVTFQFDLPTSWTQVEVLPSARTPRVTWTAGDMTWTDNSPRKVPLEPLG
jgi:hypothetical protein